MRDGDEWILNGTKVFITNGGIADVHIVVATVEVKGAVVVDLKVVQTRTVVAMVSQLGVEILDPSAHPRSLRPVPIVAGSREENTPGANTRRCDKVVPCI